LALFKPCECQPSISAHCPATANNNYVGKTGNLPGNSLRFTGKKGIINSQNVLGTPKTVLKMVLNKIERAINMAQYTYRGQCYSLLKLSVTLSLKRE
jgi:hypothetical protein